MLHSVNICSFGLLLRSFRKSPRCGGVKTCTHFRKRMRLWDVSKKTRKMLCVCHKLLHDNLWVCVCLFRNVLREWKFYPILRRIPTKTCTSNVCREKEGNYLRFSFFFLSIIIIISIWRGRQNDVAMAIERWFWFWLVVLLARKFVVLMANVEHIAHAHKTENEMAQEQASVWL